MKKSKSFLKIIKTIFLAILVSLLFSVSSCSFLEKTYENAQGYLEKAVLKILNIDNFGGVSEQEEDSSLKTTKTEILSDDDVSKEPEDLGSEEENKKETFFIELSPFIPGNLKNLAQQKISEVFSKRFNTMPVFLSTEPSGSQPDFTLDMGEKTVNTIGSYTLALAANFYTVCDEIKFEDFVKYWQGDEESLSCLTFFESEKLQDKPLKNPVLVISEENYALLARILGSPSLKNIEKTSSSDEAINKTAGIDSGAFYITVIGFEEISPSLKIINIDNVSVFDKGEGFDKYPLQIYINLNQKSQGEDYAGKIADLIDKKVLTNRKTENMASVIMTGCTAMVRGTANKMDTNGILYPAQQIAETLKDADITHINNEITFVEGCSGARDDEIVFCSKPEYIELLRYVGTDVVELTGNHMNDYGPEPMVNTLEMYDNEGWKYYAGGKNLLEAYTPALFEINNNRIAFLGCNQFGPASYWATDDKAGAAPPTYEIYEEIIKKLRLKGYNIIFTFAHIEVYDYMPVSEQIKDFRRMAAAGASIVSGSQAHHAQAIEFNSQAVIFYGLGNLFFDQMQNDEVRQALITKHIFYEGKHINTILITTVLEDYCQPRLSDENERMTILSGVFEAGKEMAKK